MGEELLKPGEVRRRLAQGEFTLQSVVIGIEQVDPDPHFGIGRMGFRRRRRGLRLAQACRGRSEQQ